MWIKKAIEEGWLREAPLCIPTFVISCVLSTLQRMVRCAPVCYLSRIFSCDQIKLISGSSLACHFVKLKKLWIPMKTQSLRLELHCDKETWNFDEASGNGSGPERRAPIRRLMEIPTRLLILFLSQSVLCRFCESDSFGILMCDGNLFPVSKDSV